MAQPLFRSKRAASIAEALAAQFSPQLGPAATEAEKEEAKNQGFELFAAYCVASRYLSDCDPEEMLSGGTGDLGIDAFAIKINGAACYHPDDVRSALRQPTVEVDIVVVQAKRQRGFNGDEFIKIANGVTSLLSDDANPVNANERVLEFKECLREIYKDPGKFKARREPRLAIWYASLGTFRESMHKAKINIAHEQLAKLDCFSLITIDGAGAHELREMHHRARSETRVTLELRSRIKLDAMPGIRRAFFGVAKASELVSRVLLDENRTKRHFLYEDNTRDFLGEVTAVNDAVGRTLANPVERARFAVLNNGITIVTRSLSRGNGGRLTLRDPQIVNGCQTCNLLVENSSLLDDSVTVSIRVVESDDEDAITNIVEATNRQNQLSTEDLVARNKFHRHLEDFFLAQPEARRLYYERRQNQYGAGVPRSKIVTRRMLAQAYAAMWLDVPHAVTQYKSLLRSHGSQLFGQNDDPLLYYAAAAVLYRVNWLLSRPGGAGIDRRLRPAKYQLARAVRLRLLGDDPLPRAEAQVGSACEKLLSVAWNSAEWERLVKQLVAAMPSSGAKSLSQQVRTAELTEQFQARVLDLPSQRRAVSAA